MSEAMLSTDGHVFLDVSRPYVAWATYRGVLITPPNERTSTERFLSWWQTDLHRNSPFIRREAALEEVRRRKFPENISRLNGFFCFPDLGNAKRASQIWNGHFTLENLAEVNLEGARGRDRLDSNWITFADPHKTLPTDEWLTRYWQGEQYPGKEPIWETLVEGRVSVLGTELRTKAYELVKSIWPESLMLLEISRLGAWIGSNIGCISASLTENTGYYYFRYLMDMSDADNPVFLEKLKQLMESGHPVNWADIKPHHDRESFGASPDMRPFEFICPKDPTTTSTDWW